jgi:signal transduction histidine kinase
LLNRIVDNLLTNAAKYTTSGSLILEVGGRPGMLILQLSDTGRGIAEADIESIFAPRANHIRTAESQGVGLSGVVDLLRRIGGRIEVMSKVDVGTTFWVHVPSQPGPLVADAFASAVLTRDEAPVSELITIRKSDYA